MIVKLGTYPCSFVCHGLYGVRTHVLLVLVCDLLYGREVFLCRVEVVDCNLIHCDIHYRTVTSMCIMMAVEIGLPYVWHSAIALNAEDAAMFLLHLFARLEYWR